MSAAIGVPALRALEALKGSGMPLSMGQLRAASGVSALQLDNVVGTLVRHRLVQRRHTADGVVRYALRDGAPLPRPPAPVTRAPVKGAQSTLQRAADVLDAMRAAGAPMRFSELCAALADRHHPELIKACLGKVLKPRGLVVSVGRSQAARWHLAPSHASLSPPSPSSDRPESPTGPATAAPRSSALRGSPAATPHAVRAAPKTSQPQGGAPCP